MFRKNLLASLAITCVVCTGAYAATTATPNQQAFLTDALKGDNSEISLGQLAVQKGASADVRNFGQTLVTDHSQAKKDALAVAQALGVPAPDGMTDDAKDELARLQGMSGEAFDNEFASHMVDDHEKDIAKFRDEADSGNGSVADLARSTLPVLEKHLAIARNLNKTQ